MAQNVILVLGAGPNVGFHVAKYFGEKGFKTAAVSRNPTEELRNTVDLTIKADLEDPAIVKAIFDEVKAKLGVPNVVVYNAWANPMNPDPFLIPLSEFVPGLNVNIVSPFAVMQETIAGFKELPKETLKAFIFTGNASPHIVFPIVLNLALGKRAVAYMIESALQLYEKDGFRFYFGDERRENAAPIFRDIGGDSHAEFYYELATQKDQGPWEATFIKGVGYVDFKGVVGEVPPLKGDEK